jgi:hypothetical protein
MSKRTLAAVAVLAMSTVAAVGAAQAADDNPVKNVPNAAPAAPTNDGKLPDLSSGLRDTKGPRGYQVVGSGSLGSPAGQQVHGAASCPAGKSVLGGGVFVTSTSVLVNVNSDYPSGNGWAADVNNASGAATSFTVYAICGNTPKKYGVVGGALTTVNASSQVTNITATCPNAAAPALSGGAFSDTFSTLANINSSIPTSTGWRIDANNASGSLEHVRAYAICGKVRGYHVILGPTTANNNNTQTGSTATCDFGAPIGGGAFSGSGSTHVSINTSYPSGNGWTAYMNNNNSGATNFFRTYVVCAGT